MAKEPTIGAAIAAAARTMHRSRSLDEALQSIVEVTRDSVPGFEHVGISTVGRRKRPDTRAVTSELVPALDGIQYELWEGPCVETLEGADVVVAPDLRHDQRWPRYVPSGIERGLRSQLALRLHVDEATLGGLNLYSTTSEEVSDEAVEVATLFAAHAAIALSGARERDTLNQALATRQVTGEAVGIIMERYQLDSDRAFAFLVRVSSTANAKLRDVAEALVRGGQLASADDQPDSAG